MVNLKNELENYPIIDIKTLEDKNPDIPDNIKNSIILYNKALESLRTGSEDIAVIELKKAVSMNPSFYEAMNLLGLCYLVINDRTRAEEMFHKVVEAENNGIRASQYLKSVGDEEASSGGQAKVRKKEAPVRAVRPRPPEHARNVPEDNYKKDLPKNLLWFAAGMVVVFLICSPMIFGKDPSVTKALDGGAEVKQLKADLAEKENALSELEANYNKAKKELEEANGTINYYKFSLKLLDVEKMVSQKNYTAAADMLLLMKTIDFKGAEKEKFNALCSQAMPKAAGIAYDEGFKLYNTKKYEDAIKKFEKVKVYSANFERMDGLLYYAGKSYQELKDSRSALANFQKLIETYPRSRYTKYAEYRIKELTQNP